MTPPSARREFGNTTIIEDDARDARGARWLESVVADVRFALRYLRRNPVATTTIVLVLSLGIGANSALFSVLQSITSRPMPGVPRDDSHVRIFAVQQPTRGARWERRPVSYPELQELAKHDESFSAVAGHTRDDAILRGAEIATRDVRVLFVTPGYFTTLGVVPAAGHWPNASAGGDVPVMDAVIAHAFWEELFAASDTAIGSTLRLNDVGVRVVGVAPRRFVGPFPTSEPPGLWLPISARAPILNGSPAALSSPDSLLFTAFARLARGATRESATATARSIAQTANSWRVASTAREATWSAHVFELRSLEPLIVEQDETPLILAMMWLVAVLILLVACTNVSSILVASAVGRRHEIAVRLSLGAARSRIVRQLVTESALLAVAGGLLGLFVYWVLIRAVQGSISADLAPDVTTLLFTMAFAIGTGILFGLSPALHATRGGIASAVRDAGMGATRRSRLQSSFVVAQIAFTQPLLVLLGTMLWSAIADHRTLPDERVASQIVHARFGTGTGAGTAVARERVIARLMQRLEDEPQVAAVVPEASAFAFRNVQVVPDDRGVGPRAHETIRVIVEGTAPGWFPMLEVPILLGRDVESSDTASRDVAVVIPMGLARSFWGEADPIGRRFHSADWRDAAKDQATMVVIGVFDDSKATTTGPGLRIHTAHGSQWRRDMFLARTNGPAAAFVPKLREMVRSEAPEIPGFVIQTLEQHHAVDRREALQISAGVAAAGALASLLASIGLYAVVSLAVGQRRREIGVRIALGGRPMRVAGMFFASGVRLGIFGLLIGLPLSAAGLKLLSAQMVDTTISVSLIVAGIAATMTSVAAVATWIPARRAAAIDPAVVLRVE